MIYNSKTYKQSDVVPITLLESVTREPNEIINIVSSSDDKYLAVLTGKKLAEKMQLIINQLYIFKVESDNVK